MGGLLQGLLPGQGGDWKDSACLKCHGDPKIQTMPEHLRLAMVRTTGKAGTRKPKPGRKLYLGGVYPLRGVHKGLRCVSCHEGIPTLPHERFLPPVDCGACHEDVRRIYDQSLHGKAAAKGDSLAPLCQDCHGSHTILPASDPRSVLQVTNIPFLCGKCHKEGTPIQRERNIPKDHILKNYSQSIHGEGLFKKGLAVTAVCTSCHTSHFVLDHKDPRSTINAKNVARTCMKCHSQIEDVHRKVIAGRLWEEAPHKIPVCVECHQPHKARRVFYDKGMADKDCLVCHGRKDLFPALGGGVAPLFCDKAVLEGSVHKDLSCVKCHTGASPGLERSCKTLKGKKVDCSICHAQVVEKFNGSVHGRLLAKGDPNAPDCVFCHGDHGILPKVSPASPTFPMRVPDLCGRCHRAGRKAAVRYKGPDREVVERYTMSIHGKGLLGSGLLVTATCVSCHTAHDILPKDDPKSSVNRKNIPATCGGCHKGVFDEFVTSVHSPRVTRTDRPLPECIDCHSSHQISRADRADFRIRILDQCGKCHKKITEAYFDTYHGKVSKLGSAKTAKCQDCHGAHHILPPDDPKSTLSPWNIVETCKKCHPGSHRKFTGYLTHATHHDPAKYPIIWITFWGMTVLLLGTLVLAGAHTLAWLPRSLEVLKEKRKSASRGEGRLYRRFPPFVRKLHFTVIVSFLGLAVTGLSLKFSGTWWARFLSRMLGGFETMGFIHRCCALLTFGYAIAHLLYLLKLKRSGGKSWKDFVFDKNSLMFNRRDWLEFVASIKWFLRKGPKPSYGRWTYWEKFDYFAVFWGVAVIGSSGLILWFPEFFTLFIPGRLVNVAAIVHGDEALLATAFIFTIHFFNTHFRPDKFPMDLVMFTGRMSLEELKEERPREYEEWVAQGKPEDRLADPLPRWYRKWVRIFGVAALATGLTLVALILYSVVFTSW